MKTIHKAILTVCLSTGLLFQAASTMAAEDTGVLRSRIERMERELAELRSLLEQQAEQSITKEEAQELKEEVQTARAEQEEWKTYDSRIHLAGYAAAGWTDDDSEGEDRFHQVSFNPIFHYQYKDLFLMEAELEMAIEEDGGTEVALEYATVDWLVNDYMILLAGKFLSPIGQFQQNRHPAWVNKLPTAPSGFGHGQAIPLAEVGIQLRGGFPIPVTKYSAMNYAFYVGNGPEFEVEGGEIEHPEAEGFTRDLDNEKVYGGRLGILPFPNLELGFSIAMGDAALEVGGVNEPTRDYEVYGVDLFARWRNLDIRGEYVYQEVGDQINSIAPDRQRWSAWYAEASYLLPFNFEGVVRYANFDSTHADQEQEQVAVGLNYIFSPTAIAKLAYEFNDGLAGAPTDDDALYLQLTYGF